MEFGQGIYNNLFNFVRFQMTQLVAYISAYLLAAFFFIRGGTPFSALVVLWVNFLVTVPVAIALGFNKPPPGLMEKKPRPLKQPILSSSQWVRIAFIGILTAIITLYLEAAFEAENAVLAATMGFVAFAFLSIAAGISSRNETASAFNRNVVRDRNQLILYGIALLFTILPTQLPFLQKLLGLTSLTGEQWLIAIVSACALLLVDEVIKVFLRRSRS